MLHCRYRATASLFCAHQVDSAIQENKGITFSARIKNNTEKINWYRVQIRIHNRIGFYLSIEYGTQVWTPDLNKINNKKKYYLGGQLESFLEINA